MKHRWKGLACTFCLKQKWVHADRVIRYDCGCSLFPPAYIYMMCLSTLLARNYKPHESHRHTDKKNNNTVSNENGNWKAKPVSYNHLDVCGRTWLIWCWFTCFCNFCNESLNLSSIDLFRYFVPHFKTAPWRERDPGDVPYWYCARKWKILFLEHLVVLWCVCNPSILFTADIKYNEDLDVYCRCMDLWYDHFIRSSYWIIMMCCYAIIANRVHND